MIMEPKNIISSQKIQLKKTESTILSAQCLYDVMLTNKNDLRRWFESSNTQEINSVEDAFRFLLELENLWHQQKQYAYFIYLPSGKLIGFISATLTEPENCELTFHFWIIKEERKNGYISEAISLLEPIFFFLGIERMVVSCDIAYKTVQSLALKNGYQFEGIKRHGYWNPVKNRFNDIGVFSKIK